MAHKIMFMDKDYPNASGGGGGNANVEQLTYAEYQALTPEEKADDTIRFITDYPDSGGGGGSSSVDYSTTEQQIGTWVDGKPLYQITLTASGGSGVRNIDISSLNVDTFCGIDSRGTYGVRSDNGQVVTANYTNPYSASYAMAFITSGDKRTLELSVNSFDISSYAVTIIYTKTTD